LPQHTPVIEKQAVGPAKSAPHTHEKKAVICERRNHTRKAAGYFVAERSLIYIPIEHFEGRAAERVHP
jgi:hypothetical protein